MSLALSDLLVVSDMDGTLLTDDKELLASNLETIRLFTYLGGRFTVATGRSVESVNRYPELLPYIQPAILNGGTVLYDYNAKKVLKSAVLPRMTGKRAIQEVLDTFPMLGAVVMASDMQIYMIKPSKEIQMLFDEEKLTYLQRPMEEFPNEWNKILFSGPPIVMPEVEQYAGTRHYPGAECVATGPRYFEMMPQGINKGTALTELTGMLGVPMENTVVIGDYYNDIEILQQAGVAIAMENAPKEIKNIADEITGNCNNGGVGQAIYKLIRQYG